MIRTAVILAAGSGTRMKLFQKPKGFLNIAGKCLIEYSIEALLDHGIERIVIGTGFKSEFYDELKDRYPQVVTQRNDYYATTGSLKTLVSLGDLIAGDFLLLESDVLYDASCLTAMIQDPHENVVLLSSTENQKDGVFVEVDRDYNLVRMTKEVHYLQKPEDGILVGIILQSDGTGFALVRQTEGDSVTRVPLGGSYKDWTLSAIKRHSATFTSGDANIVVTLDKSTQPPAQ